MNATKSQYQNPTANTTDNSQTPARVQLKHVQLDHDFFQKPKIKALQFKYGAPGLVLFVQMLCDMARSTNAELDEDCIRARAKEQGLEVSYADEFIAYCLERDMIHRGSKSFLVSNRRVLQDQENMARKQEEWRTSKRQSRDKQKSPAGQTPDIPKTGPGPVKSEDLNTEQLKIEDLNLKGMQGETLEFPPDIPPLVCDALRRWADHCQRRKLRPFDQFACDAKLMSYGTRLDDLREAINHSIGERYNKIVEKPPGPEKQRSEVKFRSEVQLDRHMEMIKKFEEEERQNEIRRIEQGDGNRLSAMAERGAIGPPRKVIS